jgi:hypothetical protein
MSYNMNSQYWAVTQPEEDAWMWHLEISISTERILLIYTGLRVLLRLPSPQYDMPSSSLHLDQVAKANPSSCAKLLR